MKTHLYTTLTAVIALLFIAPATVLADKKVVAKIDGIEITEQDMRFAKLEMGPELQNIPESQQRLVLLEFLIQNQLLAKAAKKEKLNEGDDFKKRLDYYNTRAMRDAYVEKFVRKNVTEADAKKFYDDLKAQKQRRVSHILVKTEKEAKDIIAQLKKGADFAKLAKEKSTGPSKVKGGDLGFIQKGRMVPVFEKAAFALKKDEISPPVKSSFGWHVIKLTELRDPPLPEFDQIKARIILSLAQQKEQETIQNLRNSAKIEIKDGKIEKDMKAMRGSFSGGKPAEEKKK